MVREVKITRDHLTGLYKVVILTVDFEEMHVCFADSDDARKLSKLLEKSTSFCFYGRD